MMKQVTTLLVLLLIGNAAFSQNDEKANVLAVERSKANALTKHNIIYLNQVITDKATIVTSDGESVSKQQFFKMVPGINSFTVDSMQVDIQGTMAVVNGLQVRTGNNDAGAYTIKNYFTDTLQRVKGQWLIIASYSTAGAQ